MSVHASDIYSRDRSRGVQSAVGRRLKNLSSRIGENVTIGDDVFLGIDSIIGHGTVIGDRTTIWNWNNIIHDARIGSDVKIASYVQIDPRVKIGDKTNIQNYTAVGTDSKVGKRCFFSLGVIFTNTKYPPNQHFEPIVIGDDVMISAGAVLHPGVKVGDRAVIDTMAVVTHDVPKDEWWRGRPALYYKSRKEYDEGKRLWEHSISA